MLITTVHNIFHAIQPKQNSMSEARRQVTMNEVRFNGQQVTSMGEEVEVEFGSLFQTQDQTWQFDGSKWIRLVPIVPFHRYTVRLMDSADSKRRSISTKIQLSPGDNLIMIGADGYGENTSEDGDGSPIVIEYHEGQFRVLVWSNINEEEPTHVISLEDARESNRIPVPEVV